MLASERPVCFFMSRSSERVLRSSPSSVTSACVEHAAKRSHAMSGHARLSAMLLVSSAIDDLGKDDLGSKKCATFHRNAHAHHAHLLWFAMG